MQAEISSARSETEMARPHAAIATPSISLESFSPQARELASIERLDTEEIHRLTETLEARSEISIDDTTPMLLPELPQSSSLDLLDEIRSLFEAASSDQALEDFTLPEPSFSVESGLTLENLLEGAGGRTFEVLQTNSTWRSEFGVSGQEVIDAFVSPDARAVEWKHLEAAGSGYITERQAVELYQRADRAYYEFIEKNGLDANQRDYANFVRNYIEVEIIRTIGQELKRLYPEEARNIDALLKTLSPYVTDDGTPGAIALAGSAHALTQLSDCLGHWYNGIQHALMNGGDLNHVVDCIQAGFGLVYAATQPVGPIARLGNYGYEALIAARDMFKELRG